MSLTNCGLRALLAIDKEFSFSKFYKVSTQDLPWELDNFISHSLLFDILKCGEDCKICIPPRLPADVFMNLDHLPDPILVQKGTLNHSLRSSGLKPVKKIDLHQSTGLTNRNLYHFIQVSSMWRTHKWCWCVMSVKCVTPKESLTRVRRVGAGFRWSWRPAPGCRHSSAAEGHSFRSHDDLWRPNWETLLFWQIWGYMCVLCCFCASMEWHWTALPSVQKLFGQAVKSWKKSKT